eukprot:8166-Heterococcus_DN1.PRE.2
MSVLATTTKILCVKNVCFVDIKQVSTRHDSSSSSECRLGDCLKTLCCLCSRIRCGQVTVTSTEARHASSSHYCTQCAYSGTCCVRYLYLLLTATYYVNCTSGLNARSM